MTKKQAIIDSAIALFAKQGIEATSVQQITAHCGISKGAFYLSFKSKDELVLAIIEYFMKNIVIEVDQSVRIEQNTEKLFEIYFQKTLEAITSHNGLAAMFMKEPLHHMGEEILAKLQYYDHFNDETIRYILLARYGEHIKPLLYDLPFAIKGLFQGYSIILFSEGPSIDIKMLSKTLAEKADILALYTKQPFFHSPLQKLENISTEAIVAELWNVREAIENILIFESINILIEQFTTPIFNEAIVRGMVANIRSTTECSWIAYLIEQYLYQHKRNHQ